MTADQRERPAATAAPAPERFPWVPLLALSAAWFLGVAVELGPAGLLTLIASDLDASIPAVGTLTSAFALGNGLLVLPLTAIAVRHSRRLVLVLVMALFVLSNVVVAIAPSIEVADVARFVGGAAYGLICSLIPAIAAYIGGPRYAARAVSMVFTATTLGLAFGAPIASVAGLAIGWRATFLAAAALALVVGIGLWFTVPAVRATAGKPLPLRHATRLPGVLRVCVAWFLFMSGHFTLLTYIDPYLRDVGAPAAVTGLALFLLGVAGVAGVAVIGAVSRRSIFAALLAAPAAVAVPFLALSIPGVPLPGVLVAITIWGVGFAATLVVSQQAVLLTGWRSPETATGISVVFAQAGFVVGATAGGAVIGFAGVGAVPVLACVFVALALLVTASLRGALQRARNESPAQPSS